MEKKQKTGEHGLPAKKSSSLPTKEEKKKKVVHDFHGFNLKNYPPFRLGCLVLEYSDSARVQAREKLEAVQKLYNTAYRDHPILCIQPLFLTEMVNFHSVNKAIPNTSVTLNGWKEFLETKNKKELLNEEIRKWISYDKRPPGKIGENFVNGWLLVHDDEPWYVPQPFYDALRMFIEGERLSIVFFTKLYDALLKRIADLWRILIDKLQPVERISYAAYAITVGDMPPPPPSSDDDDDDLTFAEHFARALKKPHGRRPEQIYLIDNLWFHLTYSDKTTSLEKLALFKCVYFYNSWWNWYKSKDDIDPAEDYIRQRIADDFGAFTAKNPRFVRSLKQQVLQLPRESVADEEGNVTWLENPFPFKAEFLDKKYSFTEAEILDWYKAFIPFVRNRLSKGLDPVEIHQLRNWPTTFDPATPDEDKHIASKTTELYDLVTKTSPFWHDKDVYAIRDDVRRFCNQRVQDGDDYSVENIQRMLLLDEAPKSSVLWNSLKADLKECRERSREVSMHDLSRLEARHALSSRSWPTAIEFLRFMIKSHPSRWKNRVAAISWRELLMIVESSQEATSHDPPNITDRMRKRLNDIHLMVKENHPLKRKVNVPVLRSKIPDRLLQEHLATFLGPFRRGDKYYECGHGNLQFVCLTCKQAFYCSIECQRVHCEKGGHECAF